MHFYWISTLSAQAIDDLTRKDYLSRELWVPENLHVSTDSIASYRELQKELDPTGPLQLASSRKMTIDYDLAFSSCLDRERSKKALGN